MTEKHKHLVSSNCNVASLQWICGVRARTYGSMKGRLSQSISPEDLQSLTMY
jgi:hypothetical protein